MSKKGRLGIPKRATGGTQVKNFCIPPRLFNSEYYNARIGVQSADQCQVLQYRELHTVRGTIPSAAMRELEHNAWIQYRVQQENGVQDANLILSAKILGMPHNARIQHRLPQ